MPWSIPDYALSLLITSLTVCVLAMVTAVTISYRNKEAALKGQSREPSTLSGSTPVLQKAKRSDSVNSARFASIFTAESR